MCRFARCILLFRATTQRAEEGKTRGIFNAFYVAKLVAHPRGHSCWEIKIENYDTFVDSCRILNGKSTRQTSRFAARAWRAVESRQDYLARRKNRTNLTSLGAASHGKLHEACHVQSSRARRETRHTCFHERSCITRTLVTLRTTRLRTAYFPQNRTSTPRAYLRVCTQFRCRISPTWRAASLLPIRRTCIDRIAREFELFGKRVRIARTRN